MSAQCLTRKAAAPYITARFGLPCSMKTLEKWATVGGGPRFMKSGSRVLYRIADIDEWFAKRSTAPLASTSSPIRPSTSLNLFEEENIEYDLDDYEGRDPFFDEVTRLEEAGELDAMINSTAEKHHYFNIIEEK